MWPAVYTCMFWSLSFLDIFLGQIQLSNFNKANCFGYLVSLFLIFNKIYANLVARIDPQHMVCRSNAVFWHILQSGFWESIASSDMDRPLVQRNEAYQFVLQQTGLAALNRGMVSSRPKEKRTCIYIFYDYKEVLLKRTQIFCSVYIPYLSVITGFAHFKAALFQMYALFLSLEDKNQCIRKCEMKNIKGSIKENYKRTNVNTAGTVYKGFSLPPNIGVSCKTLWPISKVLVMRDSWPLWGGLELGHRPDILVHKYRTSPECSMHPHSRAPAGFYTL